MVDVQQRKRLDVSFGSWGKTNHKTYQNKILVTFVDFFFGIPYFLRWSFGHILGTSLCLLKKTTVCMFRLLS